MKISSAVFDRSAPDLRSCPEWALPEFAFIGRSNVGKSSLVNMLTEQRDLAKVSDAPGKTKLINFFVINRSWCLVDLPGYGYANVGKQKSLDFGDLVADFLSGRRNLRRIFVLIDSRLPPQPIDLEFLGWLEAEKVPYAIVFTKTDKESAVKGKLAMAAFMKAVATWRTELPEFFASSSKSKLGRNDILGCIARVLQQANRSAG